MALMPAQRAGGKGFLRERRNAEASIFCWVWGGMGRRECDGEEGKGRMKVCGGGSEGCGCVDV